jgi:hypothetical protein
MPICPRLSDRIYPKLLNLVKASNEFVFFGTYSINVSSGIVKSIIQQKNNNQNLFVAGLLPPPTDFIVYDFRVKKDILQAYGLTSLNQIEFAHKMATDPYPAYSVLDSIWKTRSPSGSQYALLDHIKKIAQLYSNHIIVFLEPNMHAKFVFSESNLYEGSGNLTHSGLRVNVEVYNFYPRTYEGLYRFASSSYLEFIKSYLDEFTTWQYGSNYYERANQLGTKIEEIAEKFRVRFNPKVTPEKIRLINDAYEQLSEVRSKLWRLPGHILLSKLDFSLNIAEKNSQRIIAELWSLNNQEISKEISIKIMENLDTISQVIKKPAVILKEINQQPDEYLSDYESEYLKKVMIEAEGFKKYLLKRNLPSENFKEGKTD